MKIYFTLFTFVFFINCVSYPQAVPPEIESGPLEDENSKSPPSEWGRITCDELKSPDRAERNLQFNKEIRKFLQNLLQSDVNNIPLINCPESSDSEGGVWIKGQVYFENGGYFDFSRTTQSLVISSNSYLELYIFGPGDQTIQAFKIEVDRNNSYITGRQLTLVFFEDAIGQLILDGTVENDFFSGKLSYNQFSIGNEYSGSIGKFSIYACKFLTCK